jgi:hypothetical protein
MSCYARVVVGRRVASAAFVAAVVGCSYDWNIGNGSADSPDASREFPATDGGTGDSNTPPHTSTGECGTSCECKHDQKCEFTCTKGPCNLKCTGTSDCKLACTEDARCGVTCEDEAKCNLDCTSRRSTCALTCDDKADCNAECGAGAICTRDCSRACNVKCAPGALCPP